MGCFEDAPNPDHVSITSGSNISLIVSNIISTLYSRPAVPSIPPAFPHIKYSRSLCLLQQHGTTHPTDFLCSSRPPPCPIWPVHLCWHTGQTFLWSKKSLKISLTAMEMVYAVQILIALLIICVFLIVMITTMICASYYCTKPM